MLHCECEQLGRALAGNELATTHGKECPLREGEIFGLLMELTCGIEEWASQEDGVYDPVWPHYLKAKALLGMPVKDEIVEA